jgi:hypothetical protein
MSTPTRTNRTTALPILLCLIALAAAAQASEELLPQAPDGTVELHGTAGTDRFWLRLSPPNPAYGNQRVLELVYTPPAPKKLAGSHLPDAPLLLLDDNLRLVAWNGRDTMARVQAGAHGYQVTRELEQATEDKKDLIPTSDERQVPGARGWDEHLVPYMLVLAWHSGSRGDMPSYDFFGPSPLQSAVSWRDTQVLIAGRTYRATPDAAGRLARLDDAAGNAVLTVTAWIQP